MNGFPVLGLQEHTSTFWKSRCKSRGKVYGDPESDQFCNWSLVLLLLHFLRLVFNPLL